VVEICEALEPETCEMLESEAFEASEPGISEILGARTCEVRESAEILIWKLQ
jgi:hypothetical protein